MVTGTLQNRSEARLRRAINDNVDLIKRLREDPATEASAASLYEFVEKQVASLIEREKKQLTRVRDWQSMGVLVFLLAMFGWIPVWLLSLHNTWATVGAVVTGFTLLMFIMAGVQATFWPSERRRKSKETEAKA